MQEDSVLHVVALSFEHRRGNQIDGVYPSWDPALPHVKAWERGLPFMGIPDRAHEACSVILQFTLPDPSCSRGFVFAASAYRAREASELGVTDSKVRRVVQKSLVVILSKPVFDPVGKLMRRMLFERFGKLNAPENLKYLFEKLNKVVDKAGDGPTGISLGPLFRYLGEDVLAVVKSLLEGRSVLFFEQRAELVSKMVMAIGSLLPGVFGQACCVSVLGGGFNFAPYVPLPFAELLNSSSGCKLMGTCSELFLSEPVVKCEVVVDCRVVPARITGAAVLTEQEKEFMSNMLAFLRGNWERSGAHSEVAGAFQRYYNSLFASVIRTRNFVSAPSWAWPFLDWESVEGFGRDFALRFLARQGDGANLRCLAVESLDPLDPRLVRVEE